MQSSAHARNRLPEKPSFTSPQSSSTSSPANTKAPPPTITKDAPSSAHLPPCLPIVSPLTLSASTPLALSRIDWPKDAYVKWKTFEVEEVPDITAKEREDVIEEARRKVVSDWRKGVFDGLVGCVRRAPSSRKAEFWIFEVGDVREGGAIAEAEFRGLIDKEDGQFRPSWLYPCPFCVGQSRHTDQCGTRVERSAVYPTSSLLLPREEYRQPLWLYLVSLRDKMLHYLALSLSGCRLGDGVVCESKERGPGELEDGWQPDESSLYLMHSHIHLSLQSERLTIQPSIRPSSFLNFPVAKTARPPLRTAVTLLPHGYPAYYIGPADSPVPSTALEPYMQGLGTSVWRVGDRDSGWIECWVLTPPGVSNIDNGIRILWPTHLVVQDVSKENFKLPIQPESAALEQSVPTMPWNSCGTLRSDVLRCTIAGPCYDFAVDVATAHIVAADKPVAAKLSPERAASEIKFVLADSAASFAFTRNAVQARDAARAGKAAEREQEKKERDKERAEREDRTFNLGPTGILTAVRQRWKPVLEEPATAAVEELTESSPMELLDDWEPYPDGGPTGDSVNVTIQDYGGDLTLEPGSTLSAETETRQKRRVAVLSPVDTSMDSPASVQSISTGTSMSTDIPLQQRKRVDLSDVTQAKPLEPLTPRGLEDEEIRDVDKSPKPTHIITARSPSWEPSAATASDNPSLSVPSLFSQGSTLLPVPGSVPRPPRSDVSADDGMDGFGLTEDDFAFYDAPKAQEPLFVSSAAESDDPPNNAPESLPSPPADVIPLDSFQPEARLPSPDFEDIVLETFMDPPVEEDAQSLFEAEPGTPVDGDQTPVAPMSPIISAKAGFSDPFEPLTMDNMRDSKYTIGKFALEKDDFPFSYEDMAGESCFFTWETASKPLVDAFSNPHIGLAKRWQGMKRGRDVAFGEDKTGDVPSKRLRCSWVDVEEVKRAAERRRQEELALEESSDATLDDETLVVIDDDEDVAGTFTTLPALPSQLLSTVSIILGNFSIPGFTPPFPVPASLPRAPSPPPVALTPVSPAAFIQDNTKKGEDTANAMCMQAVEDPILCTQRLNMRTILSSEICWTTTSPLGLLKRAIDGALAPAKLISLGDLFDKTAANRTEQDRVNSRTVATKTKSDDIPVTFCRTFNVAVGVDGAVISSSWPAVRFWDKLALCPVGGQKDVLAFALYDKSMQLGGGGELAVKKWLDAVGQVYLQRGYGRHKSGDSDELDIRNGLVPGQLEDLETQIGTMIETVPHEFPHVVIYVLLSAAQLALSSPVIQKLGQALAGSFGTLISGRAIVHLVPQESLWHASHATFSRPDPLALTALAVYERLLRTVTRTTLRKMYAAQPSEKRALQFPAITIARPAAPKVEFKFQWPTPPTVPDVIDRSVFLHIAYCITADWLLATCIDQYGEANWQRVWSMKQGEKILTTEAVVAKIWAFSWKFARRARKEWRIVIARWGSCPFAEVEAWESLLKLCSSLPLAVQISLVCIEGTHWQETLPNREEWRKASSPASPEGNAHIVDASGSSYGLLFGEPVDTCTSDYAIPRELVISSSPSPVELWDNAEPPKEWLRPLYTALLMHAPANGSFTPSYNFDHPATTMTTTRVHLLYYAAQNQEYAFGPRSAFMHELLRSYQELALFSREKWGRSTTSGILPWHLGALFHMERILNCS